MNRSTLIFGTVCVTALVSLMGWNYVRDNKVPNFTRTAEIYVYPETSPRRVIDALGRKLLTNAICCIIEYRLYLLLNPHISHLENPSTSSNVIVTAYPVVMTSRSR